MLAIYLAVTGLLVFVAGVAVLGSALRRQPTKGNAERYSRMMHFLFFAMLGVPFVIGFFIPGLTHLDALLNVAPLPLRPVFLVLGILLALPGLYLMGMSNRSLRVSGSGANAFKLTQRVVEQDVYQMIRNPMSLGYYLIGLSIAFLSGSTILTLYVLLGIIPAHLFFLKYFEERELELRFGESYKEYRRHVPFLMPKRTAHPGETSIL